MLRLHNVCEKWMNMTLWCDGADRRKTKYSKNTPPIATFSAPVPHRPTWD